MPAVVSIVWNLVIIALHRALLGATASSASTPSPGARFFGTVVRSSCCCCRRCAASNSVARQLRLARPAAAPGAAAHGADHDHARHPQLQRARRLLLRPVRERPRGGPDRLRVPPLPAAAGDLRDHHRHGAVPDPVALRGRPGHRPLSRDAVARRAADASSSRCRSSPGSWSCRSSFVQLIYQHGAVRRPATRRRWRPCLPSSPLGMAFANVNIMFNRGFQSLQRPWLPLYVASRQPGPERAARLGALPAARAAGHHAVDLDRVAVQLRRVARAHAAPDRARRRAPHPRRPGRSWSARPPSAAVSLRPVARPCGRSPSTASWRSLVVVVRGVRQPAASSTWAPPGCCASRSCRW